MRDFSSLSRRRRWARRRRISVEVLELRAMLASDFGDAPAPYPTLLADNGAEHDDSGPTLGAVRDAEADGLPSPAADGDGADDDGVTFGTLRAGAPDATVVVNVQGGPASLDAWIDFDGDGVWVSPDEQIFAGQSVAVGDNNLTFAVPAGAQVGATFARFRLSTAGNLGPTGLAADGEVEDYGVSIDPRGDLGDAPAPYPTLLANNGALHDNIGPRLGAVRDAEADGLPSPAADGDGADEDGVTFGALQVGALDATVTVNVQGGAAKLDAWIDFNNDGVWGGPGEKIFDGRSVATGNNNLKFDVPAWAQDGVTFARFRLSTAGNLGPVGIATNGEVEDHSVAINPAVATDHVFSSPHVITSSYEEPFSVDAADIDGDGDMDVLAASRSEDRIAWFENNGNETFTERVISTIARDVYAVKAADLDGDGDMDALATLHGTSLLVWYRNNGSQAFTRQTISLTSSEGNCIVPADVDLDGDLDVVTTETNDRLAWHENDGNESFTLHVVSTTVDRPAEVSVVDLDGDGDLDLVVPVAFDDEVAWFENDGNQSFSRRTVTSDVEVPASASVSDLDRDGDMDVVVASAAPDADHPFAWFENNGNQSFTTRIISTIGTTASDVSVADLDGDGDADVLGSQTNNTIAWFENDGDQDFTRRIVSQSTDAPWNVLATDLDGDGTLDVLSSSVGDDKIVWFGNITPPTIAINTGLVVVEGGSAAIDDGTLLATDPGSAPDELFYRITSLPIHGQLEPIATPGVAITDFTQAQIDANQICYRHNGSETLSDSFRFSVTNAAGGVLPETEFSIVVTPANDAPQLNTALNATLAAVVEKETNPPGTLVSDLLLGAMTDGDAGAQSGLAVTAASNFKGTWQYTLDGANWLGMGEPTTSAALLLPADASTRVRFVPNPDFVGSVRLWYQGWDQTAGTIGGTLNVVGNSGGDKSLSAGFENAALAVTPGPNVAPVLNDALTPSLGSIKEDTAAPAGTFVSSLLGGAVSDPNAGALRGIAVITAPATKGTWQFQLSGAAWNPLGAVSSSAALLLPSDAKVRFIPNANFHGTVSLSFHAWDRTQGSTGGTLNTSGNTGGSMSLSVATDSAALVVTPVNDKPVLNFSGSVGYVLDKPAITLAPNATLTDIDSPAFFGGTLRVSIVDGVSTSNRLTIGAGFTVDANNNVLQGTTIIGKRVSNGFGTKELAITFNASATKAVVQQLVRAISFKTVGGTAGQRRVVFTVSDGDGGVSAEVFKTVNVT